ncbi:BsuBI/PstI family type II restriction endonuclease [Pontiella sp.]|uniref:BsuBI/PstI family type II restriction endonuclease n=1 Tax=Pontiella sp. TaxID=2837462 RepID=UPI0035619AE9
MSNQKNPFKAIGSNLRMLREEAGLTLKEVATAVDLDVSLLSKVERNVRLPTQEQCTDLAAFYGVSSQTLTQERLLSKVYAEMGAPSNFDQVANQVREPGVAYLDNKSIGLMGLLDFRRLDVSRQISAKRQSQLGQFFTPSNIAEFMVGMVATVSVEHVRLLDPGAGIGSLTAAFVTRLVGLEAPPKSIEVTAFEIDPFVRNYLEVTLNVCGSHCREAGVEFSAEIIEEDFILYTRRQFEKSLFEADLRLYTHTILNPPYKKIGSQSEQRKALRSLGIETGNLYSAFTALAIKWLEDGGEMVAITPRSFCNGSYFIPFRKFLLEQTALRRIHVFEQRDLAFSDDDVLQENIIINLIKGQVADQVVVSCSSGSGWDLLTSRTVDIAQVVDMQGREHIVHVAVNDFDQGIVEQMNALPCRLEDLGISVSTGRVVDFRAKEFLHMASDGNTVPLYYPGHMVDGETEHPKKKFRKAQFVEVCEATEGLLLPPGSYVVVKRFSTKEEPRRIVAALCRAEGLVGFENHLNVYHANGLGLPDGVVEGVVLFLNSTLVDMYFRLFSGHTQVNAGDLKRLRYPSLETLKNWGRVFTKVSADQDMIDELVEAEADRMAPIKRPSKRKIKQKIKEALAILQELGLPKEQQNERSALTLLALAGLVPEDEWSAVGSPLIGITPIMDFCRDYYGVNYAPNTRETFRRQTMHQFVQAGLVRENPDDPIRATNSPKWCYQLEGNAKLLLGKHGTGAWDSELKNYLEKVPALKEQYEAARDMEKIPVRYSDGAEVMLSPGTHNKLVKAIIEQFCPRFAPAAEVLYIGDTKEKFAFRCKERMNELGCSTEEHGKMPDVIVFYPEKEWLILIESVTSHGPVDAKRHTELASLFSSAESGIVYVTAFPDRRLMAKYLGVISWETEVWVADSPDHLIHFNGERFLGPH